jgi:hypothetical protein
MQNSEPNQEPPIYLFISQNCKHCHKLIQNIQKKPELSKKIQGVPVESVPKLPDGVTKVPALLIKQKVLLGKQCFEWVDKYGEIESGPTFTTANGFESAEYSYLDDPSGPSGSGTFSFIGDEDGSQGIDRKAVDSIHKKEQSNNNSGGEMDMDTLRQKRMKEIGM